MPDFFITCVTHSTNPDQIASVGLRKITNGVPDITATPTTKAKIITLIGDDKKAIYTATKSGGEWKEGAQVVVYKADGESFIRTDANKEKKDNLGSLPKCP